MLVSESQSQVCLVSSFLLNSRWARIIHSSLSPVSVSLKSSLSRFDSIVLKLNLYAGANLEQNILLLVSLRKNAS